MHCVSRAAGLFSAVPSGGEVFLLIQGFHFSMPFLSPEHNRTHLVLAKGGGHFDVFFFFKEVGGGSVETVYIQRQNITVTKKYICMEITVVSNALRPSDPPPTSLGMFDKNI